MGFFSYFQGVLVMSPMCKDANGTEEKWVQEFATITQIWASDVSHSTIEKTELQMGIGGVSDLKVPRSKKSLNLIILYTCPNPNLF